MPIIHQNTQTFRAPKAWGARPLAEIEGATVRLHWTDQPYRWHVNDGVEAFVVLHGEVEMRWRANGTEEQVLLQSTDVFIAGEGDEHCAYPRGEARILVVERAGSV